MKYLLQDCLESLTAKWTGKSVLHLVDPQRQRRWQSTRCWLENIQSWSFKSGLQTTETNWWFSFWWLFFKNLSKLYRKKKSELASWKFLLISISKLIFNSKWNLMLLYSPYSLHHSIFKWNEWNVSPRLFLISSLLELATYVLLVLYMKKPAIGTPIWPHCGVHSVWSKQDWKFNS